MKKIVFAIAVVLGLVSCSTSKEEQAVVKSENSVQLIRNATLKVDYAGTTFLVDPVFSGKGELMSVIGVNKNPTVHLTMPIDSIMSGVEFVLATHSHFDHFDKPASVAIGKDITLYVQPADSVFFLNEFGMNNTEVIAESKTIGGLTIYRTGGEHGKGKIKELMGDVSGFVLQADGAPTVYIVGDCLWTDEIKANIAEYQPDWVIINSGGAIIPDLSPEYGTLIMNEKDVVEMIKESPAKCRFIAVHMDAIDHCQTTRSILRNEADNAGIPREKLIIPADGETVDLK